MGQYATQVYEKIMKHGLKKNFIEGDGSTLVVSTQAHLYTLPTRWAPSDVCWFLKPKLQVQKQKTYLQCSATMNADSRAANRHDA